MNKILKYLVGVGNLAFLIYILSIWIGEWDQPLLMISIIILMILNIFMTLFNKDNDSWLSLFLRRKTLEEQIKIDKINKKG